MRNYATYSKILYIIIFISFYIVYIIDNAQAIYQLKQIFREYFLFQF